MTNKGIPEGEHSILPYLVIKDVPRAIEFYKKAFGALERGRHTGPDGKTIVHANIRIGDSTVFLTEENPEWSSRGPLTLGGTPVSMYMYVENADSTFKNAIAAGATEKMPLADMFWGDRWGQVTDPFGHIWQIATFQRKVSEEDMKRAMDEMMSKKPA